MAEADEYDVEAARAAAVEAVRNDPDHRVSLVDDLNVAAEHGDAEHGSNAEDEMAVEPGEPEEGGDR